MNSRSVYQFYQERFYQIKILLANMYNNSFFKKILVVACVVFLYSCDKDYNSIGDGLMGTIILIL
jgi:hypothetical protein